MNTYKIKSKNHGEFLKIRAKLFLYNHETVLSMENLQSYVLKENTLSLNSLLNHKIKSFSFKDYIVYISGLTS